MKKPVHKITFLIIMFSFSNISFSQNLIPNPSFEDTVACPTSTNQTNKAAGWNIDINSSDYYNSCASFNSMVSVPTSGVGYQCPANGNAFCGFHAYRNIIQAQYREYFGRALSNPLVIGQKYFISFKLNLANDVSGCAVNKIGIKFTNIFFGDTTILPATPVMNNMAHFYTNLIISDTSGWTTIRGTYIADSSYQYFLIGNFFDDSNTDTIYLSGTGYNSYYLIDDICIAIDSLSCEIPDGSNICNTAVNIFRADKEELFFFPNPTKNIIQISTENTPITSIKMFNILGELVFNYILPEKPYTLDISSYPEGMYIVQIQKEKKIFNNKITVLK